ncbi:MAG: glycosyltransferase family 2 protein [Fibrobacteraceae bacterium]|nr:glycosyltransferase family 2 protein [Fibrobacteraceae bacterium]
MENVSKTPLVSVLLASFNHEKYVEKAVRSVMAQQGVNFELIVVDDGSNDRSPEILEALQKELGFRYVHRPNKGFIPTMNELLSLAQGKYFCSFASDDIMPENRLALQSDYLEKHPESVACFGQIINIVNGALDSYLDPRFLRSVPRVSFDELFLGKKSLHGCSEMIVREKVLALGGYNQNYFFEDIPLFLSLLYQYGAQPVLPNVICCYYRTHDDSMHLNENRIFGEILKVLDLYKNHPLYPKAVKCWKANWFSALAYTDKKQALLRLPELASFSKMFLKKLPKLFIPRKFLPY